ncbi:MAG: translation initiation factor IF-2 [Geothrix sp.]|uniref:Translation initiation factor IF-2 n=1 Tax=Candidatus Geothrix odensensis TaxID=2954440 RepID=A0A936K7S6_9BACT|nr:translation initiation factor IF-2 [Candidatus Geothrix odensensis]MBP7618164.1 translation initiation factor IF-2 [Geothrix sp.]
MLRINQLAKELGVANQEVIEACEKRLGLPGKSHSSNLTDDQADQLRRGFQGKHKGDHEAPPLALHKPSAAVKVVKGPAPAARLEPKAEPRPEPQPEPAKPAPAVLVKKAEPRPEPPAEPAPEVQPAPKAAEPPAAETPAPESPARVSAPAPAEPVQETFSRLKVSTTAPAPAPREDKPARYIQLPPARPTGPAAQRPAQAPTQPQAPAGGPRPEAGARPIVQRPGQSPSNVQRSGMPQKEKAVLQMATNTGRGEVRHEPVPPATPARRPYIPPAITEMRTDQGFSRIKTSDTPAPAPRSTEPARYIQLPQARPAPGSRPSGPGGRPGGPGGPGRGPGGPGGRPSGPGGRPGGPGGRPMGSRPGGPGRGPSIPASGPIDPNSQKGPGRGAHVGGKKKKGGYVRSKEEELDLKLRQPRSRAQQVASEYIEEEIGIVMLSEGVTVKELAEKCNRPAKDVVAKLLHRGIFATINQPLDTEMAKDIAREFGFLADIVTFEEDVQIMADESGEVQGEKRPRPPVVTIMGHVDHGKTSLLDAIRKTKVAAGEAGGITQHVGAYHVDVKDPNTGEMRQVVFLDTPGHEAFTKMRARGAKVTDIAILVVAADDGVMPQTVESINHAKAADVPLIVAVNKVDKPGANPDKVQQGLLQHSVQTEAYGGDVPAVLVSAKTKQGLDELLETILLVADLKELKAVFDCPAAGSIIEGRLDRGRGPVATVLVQRGTLKAGDIFVAGATMGRVRAMFDDLGRKVTEVGPSSAVQILGFEEVPSAGDNFQVVEDEAKARTIATFRQEKAKQAAQQKQRATLETLFSTIKDGQVKELALIIKADTQGSVESLVGQLERLSTDKVRVRIIHSAAGTVTENDVLLAEASKATIIGFHTKAEKKTEELAREEGVDLRFHDIIYKVTEEIEQAMVGMLDATEKETVHGQAEVRQLFKIGRTVIAGSFVTEGKVQKSFKVRVKRGEAVLFEGGLKNLKRFKEDVTEVKNGLDCGISLEGFDELKEGDILEFFSKEKVIATTLS